MLSSGGWNSPIPESPSRWRLGLPTSSFTRLKWRARPAPRGAERRREQPSATLIAATSDRLPEKRLSLLKTATEGRATRVW